MSFDINTEGLMDAAAEMFNALWPIFVTIVGLGIGIKLVTLVRNQIMGSF